nr:hypothetical protein BaRGS_017504 [Batillaria attramentaria]
MLNLGEELELEYAADLKKTIIPVKVEADFTPSGWLGLVAAGKLYYDFTDRRQFGAKFQELLIAVREVLKKGGGDPVDGETSAASVFI